MNLQLRGSSVSRTGRQKNENLLDRYIGLVGENNGTIKNMTLRDADVQVNVEQDRITAISLNNLSETTAAMYPLMEPALDSIASQIYVNQTTEGLIYGEDDRYTSELLVSAINQALEQAQNPSSAES